MQTIDLSLIEQRLSGHSVFSPSSSAMWSTCSGSLIPNILNENDTSGYDAAYGTAAHEIAEQWLNTGVRPDDKIGTHVTIKKRNGESFDVEITYEMVDAVEQYVDWCLYMEGDNYVETKVDFSDLTPIENQKGTADHANCVPKKLTVTDLKMGKGVRVYAKENTQALLYAYGFFKLYDSKYDFQEIEIRIAKPRIDHFDTWTITREELLEKANWLKERAHAAWCTDASRTPSEKGCQFCKIKSDCTAFLAFLLKLINGDTDNLTISFKEIEEIIEMLESEEFNMTPIDVGTLTIEQKAKIAKFKSMVEKWLFKINEDLLDAALQGKAVPGFKVVEGSSDRKFTSEENVVWYLSEMGIDQEKLYNKKLVGIGAAEELLRSKGYKRKELPELLSPVVHRDPGRPTLVPDHDKRQALNGRDEGVFSKIEDDESL